MPSFLVKRREVRRFGRQKLFVIQSDYRFLPLNQMAIFKQDSLMGQFSRLHSVLEHGKSEKAFYLQPRYREYCQSGRLRTGKHWMEFAAQETWTEHIEGVYGVESSSVTTGSPQRPFVIMALVGIACGITHHAVAKSG
jgi:hypothetical protein